MRVLVAEDDPGLRDVIVLGLNDAGYHVDAVERGDDAIDQLRWYDYDVAIIAVAHQEFRDLGARGVRRLCRKNHVVYDIKHVFPAAAVDGRL